MRAEKALEISLNMTFLVFYFLQILLRLYVPYSFLWFYVSLEWANNSDCYMQKMLLPVCLFVFLPDVKAKPCFPLFGRKLCFSLEEIINQG